MRLFRFVSFRFISFRVVSFRFVSFRFVSCRYLTHVAAQVERYIIAYTDSLTVGEREEEIKTARTHGHELRLSTWCE